MDAIHCLLSVLLVVADVPGAQSGEQPNAQVDRPNPLFVIGDTVTAGHMEYKASGARWTKQLLSKKGTDLRSESSFLVIDLMVRNHDRVERTVPPFLLIDDSGKSHDIVGVNDKAIGTLNTSDSLKPNQGIRGTVAFDVDRTKKYKLRVYDGFDAATAVLIELKPHDQITSGSSSNPKSKGASSASKSLKSPTVPMPTGTNDRDRVVRTKDGKPAPLAANKEIYDALIEASVAHDIEAVAAPFLVGLAWELKNGTKVRILSPGFFSSKVLVIDGEYAGKRGIIAEDFLK